MSDYIDTFKKEKSKSYIAHKLGRFTSNINREVNKFVTKL